MARDYSYQQLNMSAKKANKTLHYVCTDAVQNVIYLTSLDALPGLLYHSAVSKQEITVRC